MIAARPLTNTVPEPMLVMIDTRGDVALNFCKRRESRCRIRRRSFNAFIGPVGAGLGARPPGAVAGRESMRKIKLAMYVALDGVVENPAWTGPFWNDELATPQHNYLFASDALLLGRVIYEGFAAAWPKMTGVGTSASG
jgi:hypothetical protein